MKLLSKFKKSQYAKDSTILMVGTVVSMVLQSVSMIWLGKLYIPEYMGLSQYFSTAYSILLIIATGRYELAIMLPLDEKDGFHLSILSSLLSISFSAVLGIGMLAAKLIFSVELDWVAFLPIVIPILGVYFSFNYWLNRNRQYKKLALNRVLQGVLFVVYNTAFAYILPDRRYGMIIGYTASQFTVMLILVCYIIHDYKKLQIKLSFADLKRVAMEYAKFPKLSAPSGVINTFAVNIPVLLLGVFSGSAVVGQFRMMNQVLGAPITVIAEAIRDVFRQKASRDYAENGECAHAFNSTFKSLAFLAIIPFALLMIVALPVFKLIWGETYVMAAIFIIMMSPFYYVKFIVAPLTYMTYIAGRQDYDMKWQIAFCVCSAAAFTAGFLFGSSAYVMMICFGMVQAVLYLFNLRFTRRLSKGI